MARGVYHTVNGVYTTVAESRLTLVFHGWCVCVCVCTGVPGESLPACLNCSPITLTEQNQFPVLPSCLFSHATFSTAVSKGPELRAKTITSRCVCFCEIQVSMKLVFY